MNAEEEFEKYISNRGQIIKPTPEQDMYEHWDIAVKTKEGIIRYDVKDAKKINRSDNSADFDINWLELRNVRGDIGWLKGKADYIAFKHKGGWIEVERKKLLKFAKEVNITPENKDGSFIIYNKPKNPRLYQIYSRAGRNDRIMLVKTEDLIKLTK